MNTKVLHMAHTLILCFTLLGGCKDHGTDVPPEGNSEKKWEVVPEFVNLDIRYMIHFKDELYAAVVNYRGDTLYKGAVLKTSDGDTWKLVKTFTEGIGPMTVEGDSLYVNSDHFIHKMNSKGEWVIKFGVPWQIAEAESNGDMIFIGENLYVTQTLFTGYLYMVTPDSVWNPIYPVVGEVGPAGGKFIKHKKGNTEIVYLRLTATSGNILQFSGTSVIDLQSGLPKPFIGVNSMMILRDTLFAGFKGINNGSSGMIMYLDNHSKWRLYLDSLPNSKSAFNYKPPQTTLSIDVKHVNNRIFVATDVYGVLEWRNESGWQKLNKGLILQQGETEDTEQYNMISFLEHFQGKLFVGYGNPAFSWGTL